MSARSFGTMVDDISLYFLGTSDPLGPRAPSSWARGEKPVLSTLSVPDSRGIDSGPFNDLRLEAVLSEVLAVATQNPSGEVAGGLSNSSRRLAPLILPRKPYARLPKF